MSSAWARSGSGDAFRFPSGQFYKSGPSDFGRKHIPIASALSLLVRTKRPAGQGSERSICISAEEQTIFNQFESFIDQLNVIGRRFKNETSSFRAGYRHIVNSCDRRGEPRQRWRRRPSRGRSCWRLSRRPVARKRAGSAPGAAAPRILRRGSCLL